MTQQHRHTAKIIEAAVLVFHISECAHHNSEHTEETQKLAEGTRTQWNITNSLERQAIL